MERPIVKAEIREGVGKERAKKLRAEGLMPAILYGSRTKAIPLVLNSKELAKALRTEAGENVLIDLDIQKGGESQRKVVMVKEIQFDPLQKMMLHTDLYEVVMDEMVTVEVPIHLVGKAEGTKLGGILEQIKRVIQIQCLPADIPKSIDIDISHLKIGDSIHVKDIHIENARIIADSNFTIVTVVPPTVEEKVAEAPPPEVAEVKEKAEEEK